MLNSTFAQSRQGSLWQTARSFFGRTITLLILASGPALWAQDNPADTDAQKQEPDNNAPEQDKAATTPGNNTQVDEQAPAQGEPDMDEAASKHP
ncbi:MAG TPA: hypothetical protein VIC26_01360, partial [Marinagarivorans sp.]